MPNLRPKSVSNAEEDRDSFLDRGAFQPANSIEEPPDAIVASLHRVFEPEFSSGLVSMLAQLGQAPSPPSLCSVQAGAECAVASPD